MHRVGTGRPFVFAVLSVFLHAATFAALRRGERDPSELTFRADSRPLTGDTVEIDPPSSALSDNKAPDPTPTSALAPTSTPPALSRARPLGSAATDATPPPVLYGAVGVRFAGDLATTFTRAFPQAASADPAWSSIPFGSAGRAEVILVLDDEGHLGNREIAGSPSTALRRSIERTIVLLGPRAFTSRGAVTRLSIGARVSPDDVHDGLHGDVFALSAGSFVGDVGTAFFALPAAAGPGRRVDVQVRLLP